MSGLYLFDANVFIDAWQEYYAIDIAPGFWIQLLDKAPGKIVVIESIEKEILKGGDALSEWYKEHKSAFVTFTIPTSDVLHAYKVIINSIVKNEQYNELAKSKYADCADSWLCAYGKAHSATIVTHEKYAKNIKRQVKIPNVCKEFGIRYIRLDQFMREVSIVL